MPAVQCLRLTNYELRITNCLNYELRITNYDCGRLNYELRIQNYGCVANRIVAFFLQNC
jgi:hypothetical protein